MAVELRGKLEGGQAGAPDVVMLIKQYYGDKSGRQGSALTSRDILQLTEKHASEKHLATCGELLQTAERFEYSGGSADRESLLGWLTECTTFLGDLDRNWRSK